MNADRLAIWGERKFVGLVLDEVEPDVDRVWHIAWFGDGGLHP